MSKTSVEDQILLREIKEALDALNLAKAKVDVLLRRARNERCIDWGDISQVVVGSPSSSWYEQSWSHVDYAPELTASIEADRAAGKSWAEIADEHGWADWGPAASRWHHIDRKLGLVDQP